MNKEKEVRTSIKKVETSRRRDESCEKQKEAPKGVSALRSPIG